MKSLKNFITITMENKKTIKKLVTHNGSFHADDIFAAATLIIYLEQKGETFEVIRTRDEEVIKSGDYVFDVGGIYDAEKNKFDHHQGGGAGRRPAPPGDVSSIEYASFGLVWKKLGVELCGSPISAEIIDQKLVAPIDAWDNGFDLVENKNETSPYFIQHAFLSFVPTWKEKVNFDDMFFKAVSFAKEILAREIIQAQDAILAEEKVISIYKNSQNKRIIILEKNYSYDILHNFPEPLFVIYFKESSNHWMVKTVRKDPKTFKNRKDFPKAWAGLRDEELQKVTGVPDALFCHRGLFLAVAKTKEGAIKLAELALEF